MNQNKGANCFSTRTYHESLILIICLLGIMGILPFAIYRFFINDYMMALLDFTLSGIIIALFTYVWVTHRYRFVGSTICILYLAATVIIVYLNGLSTIYWAYPAILVTFFLTKARIAIILSSVTMTALTILLFNQIPTEHLLEIFITLVLLCIFGYTVNDNMHRQHKQLLHLAARDALTGTWNRRALDESLAQTTSSNSRKTLVVSLIIFDIDHFKHINDTYGHDVGDKILVKISTLVQQSIRLSDRLFRYGGEEFIIIADGANLQNAAILAESIRKKIETHCTFKDEIITISLGVSTLKEEQTATMWLKLADQALYEAKRTGRNKYCVHDD